MTDPSAFRNRAVRISRREGRVYVAITGPEMLFQEMRDQRVEVDAGLINRELDGGGHKFANLGVSGIYTLTREGEDYLLTVKHHRKDKDFRDSVVKLVSGYVPVERLDSPVRHLEDELAEEITAKRGGKPLELIKSQPARYELSGLERPVFIEGQEAEDDPRILYHAPTNSAQAIYASHFEGDFSGVDFHHKEEFATEPTNAFLIRLENGKLTGAVYNAVDFTEDVTYDPKDVLLSEAFAPKDRGVVNQNNISLEAYLAGQG